MNDLIKSVKRAQAKLKKAAPKKAKPALKEIVKKVKKVVTSKDDAETEE